MTGVDISHRRELQMRLQLSDRMASIGTLAAGVGHEINNPLTYCMGNAELIREKLLAGAPLSEQTRSELMELAEACLEGAQRIQDVVRVLRAFSVPEDSDVGPTNVAVVIESALAMAAHELRHRARVTTLIESKRPVLASEARLGQVILNLIVNAAQSMPTRPVDENSIEVRVTDLEHRVMIQVRDNGNGIPPRALRRVFEPFYTTKPQGKGTGLGLSISHQIIVELGGTIDITSEVGEGTCVSVQLPCAAVHDRGALAGDDGIDGRNGRCARRLLIIDDEPAILQTLRHTFSQHAVTTAHNLDQAFAALERDPDFGHIICDLILRGEDGREFYQQVRDRWPELLDRLTFMTGGAIDEDLRRFVDDIPNEVLTKPLSLANLRRVVT